MERREVLKIALKSGGALAFTRLSVLDTPAEAATAPALQVQQGRLQGGKFTGWQALLSTTGRAVYGTIYDPDSISGGHFTGYRVRGEKTGTRLDLDFYALDDLGFTKPVGGGSGRKRRGKTTTNFEIDGGVAGKEEGAIISSSVGLSARTTRRQAGEYKVEIMDDKDELRGKFTLRVARDGKFVMTDIYAGPQVQGLPGKISGRLSFTANGLKLYTLVALPKSVDAISPDLDPSEVNAFQRSADQAGSPASATSGTVAGFGTVFWAVALLQCFCDVIESFGGRN